MQFPPISFTDVSLMFAIGAIVLLITAELSSVYYGQTKIILSTKKIQRVAVVVMFLFLISVAIRLITYA